MADKKGREQTKEENAENKSAPVVNFIIIIDNYLI